MSIDAGATTNYPVDQPLRIKYTQGIYQKTIYVTVTAAVLVSSTVTITFTGDELPGSSVTIDEIAYAVGSIWELNTSTGAYTSRKTGLKPVCIPMAVQNEDGYMIIVNGADPNMTWDGTSIENAGRICGRRRHQPHVAG